MVKYTLDNHGKSTLTVEGDATEFCAAAAILIRRLYDIIWLNDTAEAANAFMSEFTLSLIDPDSPLFKDTPFHDMQKEFEEAADG